MKCVYIYIYIYLSLYLYIYIYIHTYMSGSRGGRGAEPKGSPSSRAERRALRMVHYCGS